MAEGYRVSPAALTSAAATWGEQSEVLRGGRKRLMDAEDAVADLGPRVGPAASAWISTWLARVEALATTAERHGDDLEAASQGYTLQETVVEASMTALLPWALRHGTPSPYPSTGNPGYPGYPSYPGYPGQAP